MDKFIILDPSHTGVSIHTCLCLYIMDVCMHQILSMDLYFIFSLYMSTSLSLLILALFFSTLPGMMGDDGG